MRLPDILIIGAQKSGTTWINKYFLRHPDIFIPRGEQDYFCDPSRYERGLDWYSGLFNEAAPGQLLAEKSPGYLYVNSPKDFTDGIPDRIRATVPDAKLLIALREPVSRLVSALNHHIERRRIAPDTDFDAMLLGAKRDEGRPYGFIERGFYARQIRAYLDHFPKEQMRIYLHEDDISARPEETIRDISAFLGVEPVIDSRMHARANRRMNTRAAQRLNHQFPALYPVISRIDRLLPRATPFKPSAECIAELHALYAPEIDELEDLLGRDLSTWRAKARHG